MTLCGFKLSALSSRILWARLWKIVGRLVLTLFIPPFTQVMVTLVQLIPTAILMGKNRC